MKGKGTLSVSERKKLHWGQSSGEALSVMLRNREFILKAMGTTEEFEEGLRYDHRTDLSLREIMLETIRQQSVRR